MKAAYLKLLLGFHLKVEYAIANAVPTDPLRASLFLLPWEKEIPQPPLISSCGEHFSEANLRRLMKKTTWQKPLINDARTL
jgi:hypothetical protein